MSGHAQSDSPPAAAPKSELDLGSPRSLWDGQYVNELGGALVCLGSRSEVHMAHAHTYHPWREGRCGDRT